MGFSFNELMGSDVYELDGTTLKFNVFDIITSRRVEDHNNAFTHPVFKFHSQVLGRNCVDVVKSQIEVLFGIKTPKINSNQSIQEQIIRFRDSGCVVLLKDESIKL